MLLLVSLLQWRQNIERTSSRDSQFEASGSTRCRAVPRNRTTDLWPVCNCAPQPATPPGYHRLPLGQGLAAQPWGLAVPAYLVCPLRDFTNKCQCRGGWISWPHWCIHRPARTVVGAFAATSARRFLSFTRSARSNSRTPVRYRVFVLAGFWLLFAVLIVVSFFSCFLVG